MIDCKLIAKNEAQVPDEAFVSGADANGQSAAVFRCTNFNKNLAVKNKDILGIKLPPKQDTTFEILFKNSTQSNYVFPGKYSHPHTVDLTSSTDILQQPQITLVINPSK